MNGYGRRFHFADIDLPPGPMNWRVKAHHDIHHGFARLLAKHAAFHRYLKENGHG